MGERGQESEGALGIALVLGEMKGDPAEQVPEGMDGLQPGGGSLGMLSGACRCQIAQRVP